MKKLLLIIATMISLTAKSQTSVYHPFPTNYGSWNYQYYDDSHNPTGFFTSYILYGDTSISGTTYKIISGGALRESNKVIYFYPDTASQEYVLYNFNLNLGDTIIHPFGTNFCNPDTVIVYIVDSVLTSDGYHRALEFSCNAIWIEGVGSLNHLLNPTYWEPLSGDDYLECMVGDSGFVYPLLPSYCITSVTEQSNHLSEISFAPNPFGEKLNVRANDNTESKIILYDILSRKLLQQTFTNSTTLNTEQLAKGIYIYEVRNKNGVIKKGKVVRE
jgi:hypothetical protein